jgi:hypothetical protein
MCSSENTDQPAAPAVTVSIDGRIAEDKTCRECGYNLRGLKTDGRCPECGSEVATSLLGHELLYASLPWLKTIARGFRYMRNAIVILLLAILLLSLSLVVIQATDLRNVIDDKMRSVTMETAERLVLIIVAGLMGYGLILTTRTDPRVAFGHEGLSARRAVRVLMFLTLFLELIILFIQNTNQNARLIVLRLMVLSPALAVFGPLLIASFLKHAISLLDRTADKQAVSSARGMSWLAYGIILLAGLIFLLQSLILIAKTSPPLANLIYSITEPLDTCGSTIQILLVLGVLRVIWLTDSTLHHIAKTVATKRINSGSES